MKRLTPGDRELSKDAFSFSNNAEGFSSAKAWAMQIRSRHGIKARSVLGLEPPDTLVLSDSVDDHEHGVSVVQRSIRTR